ncbi:polycystin-1-like protein 2 [Branchiostoma lanceolatum]|uniref:polycystin-1-like protein 2 n=1 Tax=Branchiostoma lanceolatum TaxID=7740 RepID=UPI0034554D1A
MANKQSRLQMFLALTSCMLIYAEKVPPIGLWPLNREHRLKDTSGNGNHGNGSGVSFTSGVYGERGGAAMFTDGTYVEFNRKAGMTPEHSMTILAFVYPTGTAGPVVQILTEGKGVRFGQKDSSTLFISLDKGDGTRLADLSARHALTLNSWNFIGATYSFSSGAVQLWHGGLEVKSTVVGREELAVGRTIRVGFWDEVGGSFRGRVACVQLYGVNLDEEQIEEAESRCTGGNIALGKTASLSSRWPGLSASLAVDGYTSSVVTPSGDCVHTDRETDPWFKVDLGGNYPVGRVRIYSRGQCCGEHLTFPPPLSADNYASLRLTGNDTLDEFTLCFRVRTNSRVSGTIISYATSEQSNEILLYAINQQTSHNLFINSNYATRLELGVLDGQWHHVCITWTSGRGLWHIYVDGQVKANGTDIATGHRVPTDGIMVLGQDQDRLGGGFQKFQAYTGDVSGVNMWSKVLSPAEINDVMAGCQMGDVIGWRLDDWQLGGSAQSSSYRCNDRLTTLQVNVGEHFDLSENPECGKTNNDLSLTKHGHVITIDCQEPIIGRYVTIQLVGRTDFLTLCEVEVFTATETKHAGWIPANTSWPIDSSGTPYFDAVTVFGAANVFDENITTFWNPIGLPFMYDSWSIVFDMQQSYWLNRIRVISPPGLTDEQHYPTSFELLVSDDVDKDDWSTVGTFSMHAGRQTRAHGGFIAHSRYWKLLITSTISGFQPYISEVQLYGSTGTDLPFSSIEPKYECEGNMSFYVQSSVGTISSAQSGSGHYNSDTVCSWTMEAAENVTLALNFMTLDLADHGDCPYDYIAVHDGNSSTAPLLGRFCDTMATVATTGSSMTVVFVTNSTVESTGFRAAFNEVGDDEDSSTVGFSTDPWTTEMYVTTPGHQTADATTTEVYPTDGRTTDALVVTELQQTTEEAYPTNGGTTDALAIEFTTDQDSVVTTALYTRDNDRTESPVVKTAEEHSTDSVIKETTYFMTPTPAQPDHTTTVQSSTVTETPTCRREGYGWNGTHCEDVDECARGDHSCPEEHTCLNTDGSHICFPCVAAVSVSGGGSNMSSAVAVLRRFHLQLQAQAHLECKSDMHKYKWSAFQQHVDGRASRLLPILLPASIETTRTELVIPKNVLPYGNVLFLMNATVTDELSGLDMSKQTERWVRVVPSQLVADIFGGTARSVAEGSDIVLNASSSYDPDGMIEASSLNYTWSCMAGHQLEENNSSKGLCDEVFSDGVSGPVQHVNQTKLPPGETTFTFNVTVSYPGRQPMWFTQVFWIVEEGSPIVLISCHSNCNRRANPSDRLVLVSTCSNCELNNSVSYDWTLVGAPTGFGRSDVNWNKESITGKHLPDLVVRSGVFTVPGNYVLRVEVSLEDGRRGFAEYSFETNEPPTVGSCTVTPFVGTALVTAFSVSCNGFHDQDTPLTYSYLYNSGGERLASLSTASGEMFSLLHSGTTSTMPPQLLPVGQASRDYNVTLKVRVSDAFGATSSVKLYVQVNDLPPEESVAVAGRLTSGENSALSKLVRTGDLQAVLQLSRSVSSVLNSGSVNLTIAETGTFTKIRTAMVTGLSKFQPRSVLSVNSISASLSQATRAPDQLSTETQVVASGVLSNMASFLLSQPPEDFSIEKVEESAVFIFTASINVMTGSSHAVEKATHTAETEDHDNNQNVQHSTTAIFDTMNKMNDLLLRGKRPDEKPTVFVQKEFEMSLTKQRCRNMGAQIVSTSGSAGKPGSWFRIPDASVLFGQACGDSVGSENYQTTLNPFGYASNGGMIKSSVAALQFRADSGALPVHNLTQPIEVVTPRKGGAVPVRTERAATAPVGHNLLTVHKFNVTGEGSVHITLQPDEDNATVRLYLRHRDPPTRSTFNWTFTLPQPADQLYTIPIDDIKDIRADPYTVHIPSDEIGGLEGEYYLGVEYIPTNDNENSAYRGDTDLDIRERNVTLNYTIKIFTSKCLFFDVNSHLWKSDGCKVGPLTSESQTHCLCNHLTAFGSDFQFFVAPNSLNIMEALKEFKNIRDNPAVVSTIGIIVGIYLILILWGRKKDMDDAKKMGATILGTSTTGGGLYQIVVFTGTRANSGTTAKVSIILYGDFGESGPHTLEDSNRLTFARGGVDTFLVTTSLPVGPLSHIHVWHDNFGYDPSWFLDRIIVTDLQEDTRSIFVGNIWFAVEEGDGKVERVLPVATDKQLTRFKTLFSSRTSRDFRDGHLWYSVIGRPVHSTFTRVERISCCLSLLLCAMVANIMFFGKGETYHRPPPLDIMGFQVQLPISWAEVIIGVESALLVFPVNLMIVQIFRHCAPRSPREQRSDRSGGKSSKKATGCLLPWWFIFFAWFLVLGSCAASAFFTILYGFEYGREKAEAWLLTFLTSFFFDILITQPIKIVLIGLFIALIVKTPDAGIDYIPPTPLQDDEEHLNPLMDKVVTVSQNTAPPNSAELDKARERRFVEIGLQEALHELAFYFFYILVLLVVANGNRDANMYHMTRSMENIFVSSFKGITNPEEFWSYMKASLPREVGKTSWYNGEAFPLHGVLQDRVSHLVGPITLRQVRVSPGGACRIQEPFVDIVDHCTPPYAIWDKDEESYDVGWLRLDDSANGNHSIVDTATELSPWRYRRPSVKATVPHPGKHGFYDGGGYVSELTNVTEMDVTLAELETSCWIDHKTRAVFIEFIVYNPNCNLFSVVVLLAEFTAWGRVDTSVKVTTVRLYMYTTTWSYVVLGFQIVFVLITFYYFFKEMRKILLLGSGYLKIFWNVVDLCVCLLSLAEIGVTLYTSYLLVDFNRPGHHRKTTQTYSQYHQAAGWYKINTYVLGCLVCVATLKLLKLCLFNKFVERGAKVIKMAARPLGGFMLIFAIVFSSFAMLAFLLLGASLEGYHSYISTMQTMLQMMLGSFDYYGVEGAHWILGPTMLFAFLFFFNFIIILMFLAILDEAYHAVKREERVNGKSMNRKIADLAYKRLENLFKRKNSGNERKFIKDVPSTVPKEGEMCDFSSLIRDNSASLSRNGSEEQAEAVIYGKPHDESSHKSRSFFRRVCGWKSEERSSKYEIRLLHYRPATDIETRDCATSSDRSLDYPHEQASTETRL